MREVAYKKDICKQTEQGEQLTKLGLAVLLRRLLETGSHNTTGHSNQPLNLVCTHTTAASCQAGAAPYHPQVLVLLADCRPAACRCRCCCAAAQLLLLSRH